MIGMTEIAGALGALKNAQDALKAMIAVRDGQLIAGKAGEFSNKLIDAQVSVSLALAAQADAIERVRAAEKELADLKDWSAEAETYQLQDVGFGGLAYVRKPEHQGVEPAHRLCASCYHDDKKSILQPIELVPGRSRALVCHACGSVIYTSGMSHPEHAKVLATYSHRHR